MRLRRPILAVCLILCCVEAGLLAALVGRSTLVEQPGELTEVRAVRELPAPVRRRLYGPDDARAGIADPGRAFNPSDAILDPNIPRSRLITGFRAGHRWVVAVERGGFGYGVEVLLFDTAHADAVRLTWLRKIPASYRELLELVPSLKTAG